MKTIVLCLIASLLLAAGCDKKRSDGVPAQAKLPEITGKWSGRWESGKHKGHGGKLDCGVTKSGENEWGAVFTAEFGKIKDYKIALKGKPAGDKVLFGGEVDLGKDDGGVFKWSGEATANEFAGKYEGGGDTGTFSMRRAP